MQKTFSDRTINVCIKDFEFINIKNINIIITTHENRQKFK